MPGEHPERHLALEPCYRSSPKHFWGREGASVDHCVCYVLGSGNASAWPVSDGERAQRACMLDSLAAACESSGGTR